MAGPQIGPAGGGGIPQLWIGWKGGSKRPPAWGRAPRNRTLESRRSLGDRDARATRSTPCRSQHLRPGPLRNHCRRVKKNHPTPAPNPHKNARRRVRSHSWPGRSSSVSIYPRVRPRSNPLKSSRHGEVWPLFKFYLTECLLSDISENAAFFPMIRGSFIAHARPRLIAQVHGTHWHAR